MRIGPVWWLVAASVAFVVAGLAGCTAIASHRGVVSAETHRPPAQATADRVVSSASVEATAVRLIDATPSGAQVDLEVKVVGPKTRRTTASRGYPSNRSG